MAKGKAGKGQAAKGQAAFGAGGGMVAAKTKRAQAGSLAKGRARGKARAKSGAAKAPGSVYVLLCRNGCYYVGSSGNVEKRVKQHASGGSVVSLFGGVQEQLPPLTQRLDNIRKWERDETTERMYKHGISKVRGSEFSQDRLSHDQLKTIESNIIADKDLCRACGHKSHMQSQCYAKTPAPWKQELDRLLKEAQQPAPPPPQPTGVCFRCGRQGHFVQSCYARTHVNGGPLDDSDNEEDSSDYYEEEESEEEEEVCFRCGRAGHWASNCYARTDVNGNRL